MVTELTGTFGILPRILRLGCTSALLASMEAFVASKAMNWSRRVIRDLWQNIAEKLTNARKMTWRRLIGSTTNPKRAIVSIVQVVSPMRY
jgi:hypothetical protein